MHAKLHALIRTLVGLVFLVSSLGSAPAVAQIIYNNNFDQHTKDRRYRVSDLEAEWNHPEWDNGVSEGRVRIRTGYRSFGNSGACLIVKSPTGTYSPGSSGAQWKMMLDDTYEEVILSYHIKFRRGFDFVRGGKLPGMAGGTAPTGNTQATGTNGWTSRMMWRTDYEGEPGKPKQRRSQMISYAKYYQSGPDNEGRIEDRTFFTGSNGDLVTIKPNVWYQISQRIKMNDPSSADGVIQVWIDGDLVLDQQDIQFRTTPDLGIDQFYFSTFFGGGSSWRTSKWETIYFDNFSILAVE